MSIQFACAGCGKQLTVRDELAGKKGKCPGCGMIISVPAPQESMPELVLVEQNVVSPKSKQWHVAWPDGQTTGPHSIEELLAMIQGGQVGRDMQLWTPEAPDWAPAETFAELVPHLPAAAIPQATRPTQKPAPKGFMEKMKEASEQAARRVQVSYVSGPYDLKPNTPGELLLEDDEIVFTTGAFSKREISRVPYSSITGTQVDVAERMTLTRTMLVGIFAFGLKKKEKFLKIDFRDDTGLQVCMVLGKGPFGSVEQIQGKILQARHESLKREGNPPDGAAPAAQEPGDQTDIASQIEKLAKLHQQGILTDEEFRAKKTDLLSRL